MLRHLQLEGTVSVSYEAVALSEQPQLVNLPAVIHTHDLLAISAFPEEALKWDAANTRRTSATTLVFFISVFCCQNVYFPAVTSCLIPNATSITPGSEDRIVPAV